jgi:MFS family permease
MDSSSRPRRSPLWYHGWNIVAVCVLSQVAVSGLTVGPFSLFLHGWSVQLHSPISTFTLGFSAFGLMSALLSPLAGVCADKYPSRYLFGSGLLVMALVCLAMSFVTATWQVVALFAVPTSYSACFAALVPANAVVSRWFTRRLGLALGLTALGQGLPGVILPPIVAAGLPTLGWRMIWRIGGLAIGFIILPIVIWALRDRPTECDGAQYLTGGSAAHSHHAHHRGGLSWRDLLKRRNFRVLVVVFLVLLAGQLGTTVNLAPIITSHGLTEENAGVLLAVFNLSLLTSTLIAGMLSDRFGNRLPLAGLAFASTAGSLLIAFGDHLPLIALGIAFVGFSAGFWPLLATTVAAEFGAENTGRAFGLIAAFMPLIVLTPFMIAKTQEAIGSYVPGLSALALLSLLGGTACLLLMRERRNAQTA